MAQPLVTIGIATRNRCDLLRKAITSSLGQSWPRKEVVVVDDASTDGTSDLAKEFPSVRWIRREVVGGYMSARNEMMLGSGAKYFCGLDDDAGFVGDDELEVAVQAMEAEPGWGAVAFDILDPGRPDPVERRRAIPVDTFIGCGHLLRLAAVRAVGGYAALPGLYGGEEKDLCLRFFDRGWDVVLLPGVNVWHGKTLAERDQAGQHASGVCNDLAIALRRFPWQSLWWRLPTKMASHIRFAVRHGLLRPCLLGFGRFVRAAPTILVSSDRVSAAALGKAVRLAHGQAPSASEGA